MYSEKSKLLTGQAKSGLSNLVGGNLTRKFCNGSVNAKRIVILASDIQFKTDIHPLNPRNQEALTLDAVRDILSSIKENGVNQEGIAVKCAETGKLLLLDASRRRFSCIQAKVDLPVWELQGKITDEQLLSIINDSQEVKRWSYPEHASYLLRIAQRKGIDVQTSKVEDLAQALSIGRESLRKRLEAYHVSIALRNVFIDSEGIPNSFYNKLAKIQRTLEKAKKDVDEVSIQFTESLKEKELGEDISEIQKTTLALLTLFTENAISIKKEKRAWQSRNLAEFDNKNTYAKVSKSPDGSKLKYEFSRSLNAEKRVALDSFIKQLLAK